MYIFRKKFAKNLVFSEIDYFTKMLTFDLWEFYREGDITFLILSLYAML